jgi:putative ABC transport system permease protein
MLKNYIITAFRNIKKDGLYSFIKILGLSIGLASCIMMIMWIDNERSYDRFHKNLPNLYRVIDSLSFGPTANVIEGCAFLVAVTLKEDFPEIEKSTRFWNGGIKLVSHEQKRFYEDRFFYADPDFFSMLSFDLIRGNANTALSSPQSIVLSESAAMKYFGNEDPLEKVIVLEGFYTYRVSGVVKDYKQNSDFKFDFLASMESAAIQGTKTHWTAWWYPTYILINSKTSHDQVNSKLRSWGEIHGDPASKYHLQALRDVHLYGLGKDTKAKTLLLFSSLAFLVLVLACINYTILTVAQIGNRAKEIGMRKVIGAGRLNVILQFLGESVVISLISLLLAIIIVVLFLPTFNSLASKQLNINDLWNNLSFVSIIILSLVTGILAGGFPSFVISSLPTLNVLKGLFQSGSNIRIQSHLGKYLVVLQFSLAVALLICAIAVQNQMNFIESKPLGIEKDNLICIELKGENIWSKYAILKEELKRIPGVFDVTAATNLPFKSIPSEFGGLDWPEKTDDIKLEMNHMAVDENFLSVFGVSISEGRSFSGDRGTDATSFILNETAIREMSLDSPIGKQFRLNKKEGVIIGVVKDFHFSSMRTKVAPLILHTMPYKYWAYNHYVFVRIKQSNNCDLFKQMAISWDKVIPEFPFIYNYLDSTIDNLYGSENRQGSIISLFTILAIAISCIGLFGLISITLRKRTKEISIRKVIGASQKSLLYVMFRGYMGWIVLSNFIAWPISYYVMSLWLQNFAYRIELKSTIFIISFIISILISLVVISYHIVKLSRINPAELIRNE